MYIWYDKYRPTSIDEMIIDNNTKEEIREYTGFKSLPLLLTGESGRGKTTIARIIGQNKTQDSKNIYDKYYEFNSSSIKTNGDIKLLFNSILNTNIKLKKIVIIDEIEGIVSNDKKLLDEIINFINLAMNLKSKNIDIICICNKNNVKKKVIDKFNKICKIVDIIEPKICELESGYINNIIKEENININKEALIYLNDICKNDFRIMINILQFCAGVHKNELIDIEKIKKLNSILLLKNIDLYISDKLKNCIDNKEENMDVIFEIYNKDKSKIPLIIYENNNKLIRNININNKAKLDLGITILKNIINYDQMEKIMYVTQNWFLQYIQGLSSLYIPLYNFNKYNFVNPIVIIWTDILFNNILIQNKIKKIYNIYLMINIFNFYKLNDIIFLSEIILNTLINKDYVGFINYLYTYKLYDIKIIDKLVAIVNRSDITDKINLISSKEKKEIIGQLTELINNTKGFYSVIKSGPSPKMAKSGGAKMTPIAAKVAAKVAPVAEKVAPVAEKVAPVAEKVAPIAEKVAPIAEKVAPVAEKVAPVAAKVSKKVAPIAPKPTPQPEPFKIKLKITDNKISLTFNNKKIKQI